jgi:hypothetical protein
MAIPLIYKSCLSEKAIDAAVLDWIEVIKQREVQDKEKAEVEEAQAAEREEKQKSGEPYEPE